MVNCLVSAVFSTLTRKTVFAHSLNTKQVQAGNVLVVMTSQQMKRKTIRKDFVKLLT